MNAATSPAKAATFRCRKCHASALVSEMQLDAEGAEICGDCYLKAPPAVDVDGVFAEVAASYSEKPKDSLLTLLGAALGCSAKATSGAAGEAKVDGFPARCWFNGPFEAIMRAPKVQLEALTQMDREARELAARGQADIVRFAQMMARSRKSR